MTSLTLRVLDGADRGRTYEGLRPPITIGREEGNVVQLNDDRVSRFHVKIQEDNAQLVLTDLESTNGTRVNGEDIQLRILKHGDMITVGRSVLIFGSRDEIANRLATLRDDHISSRDLLDEDEAEKIVNASCLDYELNWSNDEDLQRTLHVLQPPELPAGLGPGQAAQLSELLEYIHIRIRRLLETVQPTDQDDRITLDLRQWHGLVDLQARLSIYMRQIGNPEDD